MLAFDPSSLTSSWSDLPDDILHLIVSPLDSVVYLAVFRSVCKSWRSFFLHHYSDLLPPPLPWIMKAPGNDLKNKEEKSPTLCCVYGPDGKNVCRTKILEASERRYIGSSGTWLIFLDPERMVGMVNPFSRYRVRVTSIVKKAANTSESEEEDEEEELIEQFNKVILKSAGPLIMRNNAKGAIAAAIYDSSKLGFIRLGHRWTPIEIECSHPQPPTTFHDIIFHHQKLYAVNNLGEIFVCDIDAPDHPPKAIKLEIPNSMIESYSRKYNYRNYYTHVSGTDRYSLVEVSGDLMLVLRFRSKFCITLHFKVFKLDFTSRKWDLVRSLGDHSLFLGENSSVSLLASDSSKFLKDHICFIESAEETETLRVNRIFEYSIKSGCLKSCHRIVYHHLYPPLLWIIPRPIAYTPELRKGSFIGSLCQLIRRCLW